MASAEQQIFRIPEKLEKQTPPLQSIWTAGGYLIYIWNNQWEVLKAFAKDTFPGEREYLDEISFNQKNDNEEETHLSQAETKEAINYIYKTKEAIRFSQEMLYEKYKNVSDVEFSNDAYIAMLEAVLYVLENCNNAGVKFESWNENNY